MQTTMEHKWRDILDYIEERRDSELAMLALGDLCKIELNPDDDLHQAALCSQEYIYLFLRSNQYWWVGNKVPLSPFVVPDRYKGCIVEAEIKSITNNILAMNLASKIGFDVGCYLRKSCESLAHLYLKMFVNPITDEEKGICSKIIVMISFALH